jgi:hypothetical protein
LHLPWLFLLFGFHVALAMLYFLCCLLGRRKQLKGRFEFLFYGIIGAQREVEREISREA